MEDGLSVKLNANSTSSIVNQFNHGAAWFSKQQSASIGRNSLFSTKQVYTLFRLKLCRGRVNLLILHPLSYILILDLEPTQK